MRAEIGLKMERFTSVPGDNLVDTIAPAREIENADVLSPFIAAQLVAASSFKNVESASIEIKCETPGCGMGISCDR
jgi:hypothetical protein